MPVSLLTLAEKGQSKTMFFFLPVGTDAPIYHWPYMTITFIVANALVFFAGVNGVNMEAYVLVYGNGLHPVQWVTSSFLHIGIFHLLGNMFFLWAFGIIVEGKLGWWKFFLLYMSIGIVESGLEQLLMLGIDPTDSGAPGSVGASSIIFGLMMICLIWAPLNEITIFIFVFFLRIIATTFNVSIRGFCIFHLVMAALGILFGGGSMGSDLLHLAGGVVGAWFGIALLKLNLVDCENWDIFSIIKGKHLNPLLQEQDNPMGRDYRITPKENSKKKKRRKLKNRVISLNEESSDLNSPRREQDQEATSKQEKMLRRFHRHLKNNKPSAALIEYESFKHTYHSFRLNAPDLLGLADALFRSRKWSDAVRMYEQYTSRFASHEGIEEVHLRLAGILVEIQKRPVAALKRLKEVDPKSLSEKQNKYYQKIENRANVLIEHGVIEMEGESWK